MGNKSAIWDEPPLDGSVAGIPYASYLQHLDDGSWSLSTNVDDQGGVFAYDQAGIICIDELVYEDSTIEIVGTEALIVMSAIASGPFLTYVPGYSLEISRSSAALEIRQQTLAPLLSYIPTDRDSDPNIVFTRAGSALQSEER